MKKLIAALMIILFFSFSINLVYASFLTSAITKLQPAMAVAGSAGSKIIPAVFSGTAAGGSVSSWISLAMPGGVVAKIAGAVIGVAGALAIDYLFGNATKWFLDKGIDHNLVQTVSTGFPVGETTGQYTTGQGHGMFTTSALAIAANQAWAPIANSTYPYCGTFASYSVPPPTGVDVSKVSYVGYSCISNDLYGHVVNNAYFYYPKVGITQQYFDIAWQKTAAYIQGLLATDLAANNADAVKVGQAAIEVTAAALENPNHPLNMIPAIKAAYQAALKEGVTAQQLTDLEAQAIPATSIPTPVTTADPTTYLTPAQIAAAVQAALAGQGLSAAQIAAAIGAVMGAGGQGLTQAQMQAAVAAALTGAGLTPPTAAAIGQAVAAALPAGATPLTAEQITAAIQAALPAVGAYTGGQVIGLDAWAAPAVGDFSGLFSGFLSDMKNTPLFSLPGLLSSSVPTGGDCTMSINMGARFGGAQTFSLCNWETGLSAMKAVLLCIASIFAVGIVAKGGA